MTDLSFCIVDGHRLAYRRSGRGRPAVLLHGITTSSFLWRDVGALLEDDSDVIALDLLGCGGSDLSPEICTRLHNDIPGSRLERIATGGHFVQIDEPEWVARQLQRQFRESPA